MREKGETENLVEELTEKSKPSAREVKMREGKRVMIGGNHDGGPRELKDF